MALRQSEPAAADTEAIGRSQRLREVARVFLWLGTIGFGGPVAHLALMESEIVARRRWITAEEFLDLVALTNLIPGPNSTEVAMALGHRRAGWPGLLVGGASFILPAATITSLLAWLYVKYGALPEIAPWLEALGPAIVGLMAGAVVRLVRPAFQDPVQIAIGIAVLGLALAGFDEVLLLVGGGLAAIAVSKWTSAAVFVMSAGGLSSTVMALAPPVTHQVSPSLVAVGLFFLKTGGVLYGGGYVLVALLQPLVSSHGWLTHMQLVDAVAAGQVTPGPILTTATFVGYVIRGVPGAIVATVAIFLPAFCFVAFLGRIAPRLRRWAPARGFLRGVNAAAVALMAAVTATLARTTIGDASELAIAGLAGVAAVRGISGGLIVLFGLVLGALIHLVRS